MERRRAIRRSPASDEPICRVRVRTGSHLAVVDVSNAGALVEGTARLLPGTHVDVHIITAEGRMLVRSRVVRAYVAHLEAEIIRYRGALAFESPIDTAVTGYPVPETTGTHTVPQGSGYPEDSSPVAAAQHAVVSARRF